MKKIITWMALVSLVLSMAACGADPVPTVPTTVPGETTQSATLPTTEPATEPPTEPPTEPAQVLYVDLPQESALITHQESWVIQGSADPRYSVEINGNPVEMDGTGAFAYEAALEPGDNLLTVTYLEEIQEYTIHRSYTTAWIAYQDGKHFGSGATVFAKLYAREGSEVTIRFNGETKKVEASINQLGFGAPEGFDLYEAKFLAPNWNKEDVDMGVITYTVTCDDITEEYVSGTLVCDAYQGMKEKDPEATPDAEGYRDVGSGYIAEVVDVNAETFNGATIDDRSKPMYNYLPQGTLDYASQGTYYNEDADRYYHLLRCGIRVYKKTDNKPGPRVQVVDCYNGYLPDHNELNVAGFAVEGRYTVLTLDSLWKAPFFFDEEEQDYRSEPGYSFILDHYDPSYIDIRFCYATVFTGKITVPEDNPLFRDAELFMNKEDCTLRLYLHEPGKFYGWHAYYNEKDQLCFMFLNPFKITLADNEYGADLTGMKIMIDVGHGGEDAGAVYSDSNGTYWYESGRNLALANLVREELESLGATVVMNRTESKNLTRSERIAFLLQELPDYCICIHHNAREDRSVNGFSSWYFTSFSKNAADHINKATMETDVYRRGDLAWYVYFTCRQTVCPIVLAENGYMSNKKDMDRMTDPEIMKIKAKALVQGIINYYLADAGYDVTYKSE